MWGLLLPVIGIALLYWQMQYKQAKREEYLYKRIEQSGNNQDVIIAELDAATKVEADREAWWRKQNPRG